MSEEKTKYALVRQALELADGDLISTRAFRAAPTDVLLNSIRAAIERDIKEAISGLSPIFGKDQILALCMKIMDEDDDADGPQTQSSSEWREAESDAWEAKRIAERGKKP